MRGFTADNSTICCALFVTDDHGPTGSVKFEDPDFLWCFWVFFLKKIKAEATWGAKIRKFLLQEGNHFSVTAAVLRGSVILQADK